MTRPIWNDPTSYTKGKFVNGEIVIVEEQCPEGTYFNLASCGCVEQPWRSENETVCETSVNIPSFAVPGSVYTASNVAVSPFGWAELDGLNSRLKINLDQAVPDLDTYEGPIVIQFRYKETQEITKRQALLSTPECPDAGFMLVTIDRESILLEVTTGSGALTSLVVPTVGFKPNDWKTLRIVDNNDVMSIMVSDGENAYVMRSRAPACPYVQCGLNLGTAQFAEGFKGQVDEFQFYQCIPNTMTA